MFILRKNIVLYYGSVSPGGALMPPYSASGMDPRIQLRLQIFIKFKGYIKVL